MFAIVEVGSMQYKVAEGESIDVQRLNEKPDAKLTLEKVLLFSDGENIKVGQPYLKEVKVTAKVVEEHLADKVLSFKYLRRKNHNWRKGHRQKLTTLNITKISIV